MNEHERARKRLAMQIAEELEAEFCLRLHSQWDVDSARESIAEIIPESVAEQAAKWDALEDELREERPERPSKNYLRRLREALHFMPGAPLGEVLEAAIQRLSHPEVAGIDDACG